MFIPSLLAKGLSRVLDDSRNNPTRNLVLNGGDKFAIFSDHHKGANTLADDFKESADSYYDALEYYWQKGYSLIIMGDSEELWEEKIEKVVATYEKFFVSEARFHDDPTRQYIRIFGNHDSNWASPGEVEKHLYRFFPGILVHEGIIFKCENSDPDLAGEIFLVHGHQGTLDSEFIAPFSRLIVRGFWRTAQILFKFTGTTPGNTAQLRGKHDTLMYDWAKTQGNLLLIAGHTHRSIWSSRTPIEQKLVELEGLEYAQKEFECLPILDFENEQNNLKKELRKLLADEEIRSEGDWLKTRGCYFNSGCCSFKDGRVTVYELTGTELRLVEFRKGDKEPRFLSGAGLDNLFQSLSFS
jgi:hypothetical protein